MEKPQEDILDLLEKVVIGATKAYLQSANIKDLEVTEQMARNLVGKIGVRIVFGKEIADPIITRKKHD